MIRSRLAVDGRLERRAVYHQSAPMTQTSSHRRHGPAGVTFALALMLATTRVYHIALHADQRRLTNVVNARLRSAADTSSSVTAVLPLGTELTTVACTSVKEPWCHVETTDGRDGWILERLTTLFDPSRTATSVESIVIARLARGFDGGETFQSRLQLLDLVERTAAGVSDRETQGRFAFHRIRALKLVSSGIPHHPRDFDTTYKPWLDAHETAVAYDEPDGQWKVEASYIHEIHDQFRDTDAADDIAWFMAQNGLRGECEGDVPCYLNRHNQLNGEYLRLHPHGRHANESNEEIAVRLNIIAGGLKDSTLPWFDPGTRCGELHASLDPLIAAVTASTSTRKADALAALSRFAQLCR